MKKITVTIEGGKVVTLGNAKELNGKTYDIPYDLHALTIEQAQKLYAYLNANASEEYRAFMAGTNAPEQKIWSSKLKEYSNVVCGAISEITGLPGAAFNALTLQQMRFFCDAFELNVIRPLYMLGLYEPIGIESFTHDGVEYMLPKMTADGFGGLLPMAEETAESWAESNDLYLASENPYDCMALIVAILCRPKGEVYDELTARQRAEKFRELPAYIAFEVFFCKLTQLTTSVGLIGAYLERLQQNDQAKAQAEA
jgi:hypothetical protein